MSEIVTATVSVEGMRVLIWNAFNPSVIPTKKKIKQGVASNDLQEWKRTVL